ncbi:MAG: hypothetical protein M1831_007338 [Alyxoria varia]|nr:MAG: hypothetical protein M1831_007338 [Alyxoria varia]
MIVQESPRKTQKQPAWPPKSPRAAFESSPSGRKRLERERLFQRSTSPSFNKPSRNGGLEENPDSSEEEDEDVLSLRAAKLECKIKLKKLQNSDQKTLATAAKERILKQEIASFQEEIEKLKGVSQGRRKVIARENPPKSVQVPSSPKHQAQKPLDATSPRRVELGIDKGVKAADVSLKRAKSQNENTPSRSNRTRDRGLDARQANKQYQSFSQRVQETGRRDVARQEKENRMAEGRRKGFTSSFNESLASAVTEEPSWLSSAKAKSSTSQGLDSVPPLSGKKGESFGETSNETPRSRRIRSPIHGHSYSSSDSSQDTELHSGFRLSKRQIPRNKVAEAFEDKAVYPIPRLLKEVKSPEYEPPDIDEDFVVIGIIASKSDPYNHASSHQISDTADANAGSQKSKFMVLHLTDLRWELDLFLFSSAFDRFWKLKVGTVIAILNPGIMPPKPHQRDSGKFSLKLGSSEDTVLEIGSATDLGFCKSVKKDGKECMTWIDSRKTEFCEFHVNLQVEKSKASRMEINSMSGLNFFLNGHEKGKGGRGGGGGGGRGGRGRGGGRGGKDQGLKQEGHYYDREAHSAAYSIPPEFQKGLNTRQLLDAEDLGPDGRLSASERTRKRFAMQEKERDLAEKLGAKGNGVGSDYMKLRKPITEEAKEAERRKAEEDEKANNAETLGLVRGRSSKVTLSPVKGSRYGGAFRNEKDTVGWSGANKRGLASPPREPRSNDARARDDERPIVKKARFAGTNPGTEARSRSKGSNPHVTSVQSDDDDLDIV